MWCALFASRGRSSSPSVRRRAFRRHGNHAAAGMWAQKDSSRRRPESLSRSDQSGLRPWNPLKEYAHVPFSLEEGAVSPKGLYDYATHHWEPAGVQNYISGKFEPGAVRANVKIPIGAYSPVNGLSAQQISRTGLGIPKIAERRRKHTRGRPRDFGISSLRLAHRRRRSGAVVLRRHRHFPVGHCRVSWQRGPWFPY